MSYGHDVIISTSLKRTLARRRKAYAIRRINRALPIAICSVWVMIFIYLMVTRF